jgi:oligopeptide/dipeptide ABC transporter ATP-binding protein
VVIVTEALLEVKDLQTYFFTQRGTRIVKAVDGVTFTVPRGQSLGLVGESGCGKTVTSLSLMQLLPPAARTIGGEILFNGDDLLQKSPSEVRRMRGRHLAMVLQDPMVSLNPLFTIGEQIAEPIREHTALRGQGLINRIRQLLTAVRIPSPEVRMQEYPHQMSGGMRQRIVGAIAISCDPYLLIADEPTTSLDLTIQAQYLNLLEEIQQQKSLSMIFITHDFGVVARMCDHVAVMYAGRVVERAPVEQIFDAPHHPYTEALLASIPKVGEHKRQRLYSIEGHPPDLAQLPTGCSFAPRCPQAQSRCTREAPPEIQVGENHYTRCWLWEEAS